MVHPASRDAYMFGSRRHFTNNDLLWIIDELGTLASEWCSSLRGAVIEEKVGGVEYKVFIHSPTFNSA